MTRTTKNRFPSFTWTLLMGVLTCLCLPAGAAFGAWYDTYDFAQKGVIGFWPLDGQALDATGKGNDGSWTGSGGYEAGRFGLGHSLTPGTYLTVSTPEELSSFSAITLSAWFKSTTPPSDNESLMGLGIDGAGPLHAYLFLLGGGTVNGVTLNGWSASGGIGTPNIASAAVYDGSWHLLTATWDGSISRVFIDSIAVAENMSATGTVVPDLGEALYINRHNWSWSSSSRLNGSVDDAVVFDHALSPAEVALLAADLDGNNIADYWDEEAPLKIVFSRGYYPNARPWIANLDGSNAQLLADISIASYPRLAGNTVVFMSDDYQGQGPAIYRMAATPGATVTKIQNTDNIRTANGPNWDAIDISPDGSQIVWSAPEAGDFYQNHNLFVAGIDGTAKSRVARDTGKHYFSVNWGESDRITFSRSNVGNAYSQRLFSMTPDGGSVTQVVADFAQNLHIGGPDGRAAMTWTQPGLPPLATMDNSFGDFQLVPGPLNGYTFTSWHPTNDVLFGARFGAIYRIERWSGFETELLASSFGPFLGGDVGSVSSAENLPPVADAGDDLSVGVNQSCVADVELTGSSSYDPEGELLLFEWTWNGLPLFGPQQTLHVGPGSYLVDLRVRDPLGLEATDQVSVEAYDSTPPTASSTATPAQLWPPNHRMIQVDIVSNALDNCTAHPECQVLSVASDEPTTGPGDDFAIVDSDSVLLRAARDGSGTGRTYTIASTCQDGSGNSVLSESTVFVPGGPVVLTATRDAFIRQGAMDTNEGANDALRIQSSGKNRGMIGFDMTEVEGEFVTHATLALTISDIADNWGTSGRAVSAHRILGTWSEGNGWTVGGNTRGQGAGVTWACPTDTEISNQQANCPGTGWDGGAFAPASGPPVLHTNGMSGEVSFDVTEDVANGAAFGWIVKKDNEGQNGKVFYRSREGAASASDMQQAPRLVLDYD